MIQMLSILFLLNSLALAAPDLKIINHSGLKIDEERLRQNFHTAHNLFSQELTSTVTTVEISVAPADCLRTGYKLSSQQVVFCPNSSVRSMGLESVDVFNHEIFHAFFCASYPVYCQEPRRVELLEALADYFAYLMRPDEYFGEHFYYKHAFIRPYQTHWREGLVRSEHEKGSAIAAKFIGEKWKLSDALVLFTNEQEPSEVKVKVAGAPFSRLNRYRLSPGERLTLNFDFDKDAGVHRVEWSLPAGVMLRESTHKEMIMEFTPELNTPKAHARFLAVDGRELGRWTFYFGLKSN